MNGAGKTPRGARPERQPGPHACRADPGPEAGAGLDERRRQALEAGRARFAALERWRAGGSLREIATDLDGRQPVDADRHAGSAKRAKPRSVPGRTMDAGRSGDGTGSGRGGR